MAARPDTSRDGPSFALAAKDANASIATSDTAINAKGHEIKSMEYHRQVFRSKMAGEMTQTYVSPSDNIMSPCTAKLKEMRNKQVGKVKPKSLFAQSSARKLGADRTAMTGENAPPLGLQRPRALE